MDEENKVTQVVKDMLWKIGASLLTGQFQDLMKMGSPAYIHSNKSYLHMISKDMAYYEHFVAEAMKRPDDPVWKLKNVALAIISSLHLALEQGTKSPLNPILGETLIQQSVNGTTVYCEQTSHHPPISHFLIEGPSNNAFKMFGHIEYKVAMQGACTSVRVTMPGTVKLELPDGTAYSVQYPEWECEGLMSIQKILNLCGSITLTDLTNKYELVVQFDAEKEQRSSGFMSMFSADP